MATLDLGKIVGDPGPKGDTGPQGIQGIPGEQGDKGDPGNDATVNGVNTLTIAAGEGLEGKQEGDTFIISESSASIESADYPGCYYRMVNGVQEWLNPPMLDGVEYRTTERYMGKVVYTKLVVFGALPDNGLKSVSIQPSGETPATYPIRGSLLVGMNVTYQGTAIGNLYPGVTRFYTGTNNISIETNANLSSYSGRVQIWYTRS